MKETDDFMQVEEDELAKYEKKKARAIRLLKNIPQDGPIEISYSGGKDSDVILELAKMPGILPGNVTRHCSDVKQAISP